MTFVYDTYISWYNWYYGIQEPVVAVIQDSVVEKVLEKSGTDKSLLRAIGFNVLKDAGYEGVTEGAQELISESAEKFVAGNPQIFDSKDWDRVMESAVRGALAGGAFGPIAGIAEHRQAKNEREQAEDLKTAQEFQKQQEEEERKAKYYQQYTKQDELPLASSVDANSTITLTESGAAEESPLLLTIENANLISSNGEFLEKSTVVPVK